MPSLGTLLDLDLPSLLSPPPHLYSKLALPNLILLSESSRTLNYQ